jgi:catechol 2,3-dioxygenase-like lactoylglutathione lyase family enzyme
VTAAGRARRGPGGARTALLALALLLAAARPPARAAEPAPAPSAARALAVAAVGMTVASAERAAEFYAGVLDFEREGEVVEAHGEEIEALHGVFAARVRVVRLRLGAEILELTEFATPRGRPIPADSRSNDRWFQHVAIVVRDIDAAYARLRAHGVAHVSPAPQRIPDWNAAAAGIRAFYFRDPDGHNLELIEFPPGKGDPRWQRAEGALFLGIDHTAIAVAATPASLAFYRDLLGLALAGESENHGPEQERLNGVFGARLRITGLRAPRGGPGVELLDYLTPRDGRPMPPDVRPNDLVHWQTTLVVADAEAAARELRAAGVPVVSPRTAAPGAGLGLRRGVLVRDPDGHALRLVER